MELPASGRGGIWGFSQAGEGEYGASRKRERGNAAANQSPSVSRMNSGEASAALCMSAL